MRKVLLASLLILLLPIAVLAQEATQPEEEIAPEPWEVFLGQWETQSEAGYTYRFEFWRSTYYASRYFHYVYVNWNRSDPDVVWIRLAGPSFNDVMGIDDGRISVFNDGQYAVTKMDGNTSVSSEAKDAFIIFAYLANGPEPDDDNLVTTIFRYGNDEPPYEGNVREEYTLSRVVESERSE